MTERYLIWQKELTQRDLGMYTLSGLAVLLVVSYLLTYADWLPPTVGKGLRFVYEVGGGLLYLGIIVVSVM